jgi:hypothetical protein
MVTEIRRREAGGRFQRNPRDWLARSGGIVVNTQEFVL